MTTIFTTQMQDESCNDDDDETVHVPLCSMDCQHQTRADALTCATVSANAMAVECVETRSVPPLWPVHWENGWAGYCDGPGSPLSVGLTDEMVVFTAFDGEWRMIFVMEVVLP